MTITKISTVILLKLISVILLFFGLCGCASSRTTSRKYQPTMAEVYQQAMQQSDGNNLSRVRNSLMISGMSVKNQKNNIFHRLANPEIIFYVYPHLAGKEDVPVPGYTTSIPMFKEVHYAMPGEI